MIYQVPCERKLGGFQVTGAFFFFLCAPSQSGERTLYLGHADSELHNLAPFTRAVSVSTGTAKGSWLDPFYKRENKLTEAGDLGAQLLKCKMPSSELSSACLQASINLTPRGAEL